MKSNRPNDLPEWNGEGLDQLKAVVRIAIDALQDEFARLNGCLDRLVVGDVQLPRAGWLHIIEDLSVLGRDVAKIANAASASMKPRDEDDNPEGRKRQ
jgi:hypothetical protein